MNDDVVQRAPGRKRATIKDVAALAGVSVSTVSHVFSGGRPISAATSERVMHAARTLRYQAHPSAKSLRTAKADIIGLIVRPRDAIHGTLRGTETFQRLLGSIAAHALEQGKGLVHVPDVLDPSATRVSMDACIIAHPYFDDEVVRELRSRGVPIVMIDADPVHDDVPWSVNIDHETPTLEILDAMWREGRRRILFLSGREDNQWNRLSSLAYFDWCARTGVEPDHLVVYEGDGIEGAMAAAREFLDRPARPDAVLAAPSTFARGILHVADERGIAVPRELALAALTDSERTHSARPPITGLDLGMEEAGAEAVRLAIALANAEAPPAEPVRVSPHIRWRESLPAPPET